MIRLATVFSGIGAIEHALDRMRLEHEIVFACDNGDIDILSTPVALDVDAIQKELSLLGEVIIGIEDGDAKSDLSQLLKKWIQEFESLCVALRKVDDSLVVSVDRLLYNIMEQKEVKKSRRKQYSEMRSSLAEKKGIESRKLVALQHSNKVIGDFRRENDISLLHEEEIGYQSSALVNWGHEIRLLRDIYNAFELLEGRRMLLQVKNIAENLSMLHERIETLHIRATWEGLPTYEEKKQYIDALYENKGNQNRVRESYMANYDVDARNFHWNVSFLDGQQYRGKVDLFVGGSPCQSFSAVGKQRGLEDTRGTLFYEFARLVGEIQPKVFIYENVKAVTSNDGGRTWEIMQNVFTDLNYKWQAALLNAKDYGVPQNRERLFVVGYRNDVELKKPFSFPQKKKLMKTMQDYLLDNVASKYYLPRKGIDFVTSERNLTKRFTQIDGEVMLCQKRNQQYNWHGDFVFVEENRSEVANFKELEKYFLSDKVKKYVLSTGTKNFYSPPQVDLEIARPLLTTMHKMHRAGVDNYVTTEGRLRKLTPRECLRLMGFCDSFKIVVSDTAMYQQAGNSIVVDVLIAIVDRMLSAGLLTNDA